MKNRPPKAFSRDAFERLSHPEKLEYLTCLMNALERARPSGTDSEPTASTIPSGGSGRARFRTRSNP